MIISKIHVHNFRGILDQSFLLQNYSLFVGPNNSGKSSMINAIRAFYEKDGFRSKKEVDFPFIKTDDSENWNSSNTFPKVAKEIPWIFSLFLNQFLIDS